VLVSLLLLGPHKALPPLLHFIQHLGNVIRDKLLPYLEMGKLRQRVRTLAV
jgi:hypothetical protein